MSDITHIKYALWWWADTEIDRLSVNRKMLKWLVFYLDWLSRRFLEQQLRCFENFSASVSSATAKRTKRPMLRATSHAQTHYMSSTIYLGVGLVLAQCNLQRVAYLSDRDFSCMHFAYIINNMHTWPELCARCSVHCTTVHTHLTHFPDCCHLLQSFMATM